MTGVVQDYAEHGVPGGIVRIERNCTLRFAQSLVMASLPKMHGRHCGMGGWICVIEA